VSLVLSIVALVVSLIALIQARLNAKLLMLALSRSDDGELYDYDDKDYLVFTPPSPQAGQ
jgi:hypothetical protein